MRYMVKWLAPDGKWHETWFFMNTLDPVKSVLTYVEAKLRDGIRDVHITVRGGGVSHRAHILV